MFSPRDGNGPGKLRGIDAMSDITLDGLLAGGAGRQVGFSYALAVFKAGAAEAAGGFERRVSVEGHRLHQTGLGSGHQSKGAEPAGKGRFRRVNFILNSPRRWPKRWRERGPASAITSLWALSV